MKHSFIVTVETTMDARDTRDYIRDAVASWGGQCFPGDDEDEPDPRFEISDKDVTVKHTRWEIPDA